jgi:hypothetical protein
VNCIHGRPFGAFCLHCNQILGPGKPLQVVVPSYTFRPFEPVDSTVYPFVVTPVGIPTAAPMGIAAGMSWAPPPAVVALALAVENREAEPRYILSTSSFSRLS